MSVDSRFWAVCCLVCLLSMCFSLRSFLCSSLGASRLFSVCLFMICSSSYMHSLGVVWGIARILFIRLSNILFSFFFSVLFRSQVSDPCVMIGIMHVSSIVHIVSNWIPLKLSSPAINRLVWSAASVFLSISCIYGYSCCCYC